MQDDEFIQDFIEEAKVHVETVETELLHINMNLNAVDMESINNIFRGVHSIKGTSSFFNFKKIVELSHALENIFGELRSGNLCITDEMVDVLLSANDCLKLMISDVMNSENIEISDIVERLSFFLSCEALPKTETKSESESEGNDAGIDIESYGTPDAKRMKIRSELKRGCRLYKLMRKLNGDLIDTQINLLQMLEEITSLGSVIECRVDTEKLWTQTESMDKDVNMEILFTSVLERGFLPLLLSEPAEDLMELSVKKDDVNIAESEDIQNSAKADVLKKHQTAPTEIINHQPFHEEQDQDRQKVPVVTEDSIRVSVTLLNSLLNMSSEMVLARNQLLRTMEKYRRGIPGIDVIFQNINHITTNLQEKIMQTRMQPVSNVFNKFPRIAHELSKKLNKDILLELEGTEVELDKSIVEALGDPLTHLVRNAVDHGLELPDERIRLEKPRMGIIKLKAYHESGYVNIDVIDDGKGINADKIKEKALEKGFISKSDVSTMGEQETLQLLFKPGFSTVEEVTDLSGRGVGMDVVKTNIEKLGGKIEIFTIQGKGTTFRLLLPLTLAIIPSLIVEAQSQKFALPQINVQEIVRIKASDPARKIEYINNSEVLRLRGKLLPIVSLANVLGLQRTYIDPATGKRNIEKRKLLFDARRNPEMIIPEVADANQTNDRRSYGLTNIIRILVIKIGSRRLGLSVDTIHGIEEILVKTLPLHIKECKNYSGVTILGDGKAAMILDPSGIIENANLRYIDGRDESQNKQSISEAEKMREHQNILLFKCSGPETLALDMSMVSRVEEIKFDEIEMIGEQEYIKFRGGSLRVIRPEAYLPIKKLDNQNQQHGKCFVIIPKLVKYPMGILIEKMHDTMQTSIKMAGEDSITAKGLIGSTILNDKIVLLLNIYELFEMANPEHYKIETSTTYGDQIRILLVEDTPFFQKIEKDYLENAGYHVFIAENGKEALQILQKEKVDAVVSDINMPEMNGLELVKRIRSDSMLSQLPVIAVTSLTMEHQKRDGLAAGFDAYEYKLDRARLLEILEQVLQKRRIL